MQITHQHIEAARITEKLMKAQASNRGTITPCFQGRGAQQLQVHHLIEGDPSSLSLVKKKEAVERNDGGGDSTRLTQCGTECWQSRLLVS